MSVEKKKSGEKIGSRGALVGYPGPRLLAPPPRITEDDLPDSSHANIGPGVLRAPARALTLLDEPSDNIKELIDCAVQSSQIDEHRDAMRNLSSTRKEESQKESILMTSVTKRSSVSTSPIPQVDTKPLDVGPRLQPRDKPVTLGTYTADDDIVEDVQIQTPEFAISGRKRLDWELHHQVESQTSSSQLRKKKEISWSVHDSINRVHLKDVGSTGRVWPLEQKISLGPCKSKMCCAAPSGVMFCVAKNSSKCLGESCTDMTSVGINISFSGKAISKKPKPDIMDKRSSEKLQIGDDKRAVKVDIHIPYQKLFTAVKSKVDVVRSKFHEIFDK